MEQNPQKKALCIGFGIFLLCAAIYLNFFAPTHVRIGVEAAQIDKVLHIIGGVFLVSLIEWNLGRLTFWKVFGIVFLFFFAWKAFEFFGVPVAHYDYILAHFNKWFFDFAGDLAATMLGGVFYRLF